jgi:hypothetical protein
VRGPKLAQGPDEFVPDDDRGVIVRARVQHEHVVGHVAVGADAGEQPIQQHTQRVDVAGRCDRLTSDLLGAAVLGCQCDLSRRRRRRCNRLAVQRLQFCNAEIQQLHLTLCTDQHVARLQIAVHHSPAMHVVHHRAEGTHQRQDLPHTQLLLTHVAVDGQAIDQLHHQVGRAVCGHAAVDQLDKVGVVQRGANLPLRLEACSCGAAQPGMHEPYRPLLFITGVRSLGLVNVTHAAAADEGSDAIGPHALTNSCDAGRVVRVLDRRPGRGLREQQRIGR